MILNHYYPQKFKLKREDEFMFWTQAVILPHRYTSAYALGYIAAKNKIKVKMYKSGKAHYKFAKKQGYSKKDVKNMMYMGDLYKKMAKKTGIKIYTRKISFDHLKKAVKENDFIIPLIDSSVLTGRKRGLHFIVIAGFKDSKFLIFDPLTGKHRVKEEVVKKAFNNVKDIFKDPLFFMTFKK